MSPDEIIDWVKKAGGQFSDPADKPVDTMAEREKKLMDDLVIAWGMVYMHFVGNPPADELKGPHGKSVETALGHVGQAVYSLREIINIRRRIINHSASVNTQEGAPR